MAGLRGLQGTPVLLTGGASGIGRAIALRLGAEGAQVGVLDLDAQGGKATADAILGAGGTASAFAVNITDYAAVERAVEDFAASAGEVRGLVNCAGWDVAANFLDTEPELWRKLIDINLVGPLNVTKVVLARMAEAGAGRIVSIASDAGRVGSSGEMHWKHKKLRPNLPDSSMGGRVGGALGTALRTEGARAQSAARRRMVARLAGQGVQDARVLAAFESVPRHLLVPEALRGDAYRDVALPIGDGQTISAPSVVAAMSEAVELSPRDSVLEIGTGSGYQAAILSRLADRVVSIERVPQLAARARRVLDDLGVSNVVIYLGDGTVGRRADAPFDAIVVTAGGPRVPEPLLEQLAVGGRLVGPFGEREAQQLLRVRCEAPGQYSEELIGHCRFVDLIGAHGWV